MKFKGILLDIDNTIYDYDKTHKKAFELTLNFVEKNYKISKKNFEESFFKARSQIHMELIGVASSHNRLLYFQRAFEILNINSLDKSFDVYNIYWDSFLNNLFIYQDVVEFLEKISIYKVCLVTDLTAHIQHRKVKKLNLDKYARYIVTSEEAGVEKPHPYIFMLSLKKLNLSISEVCFIGDNFKKDILGANNLGIDTFWLNRDEKDVKSDLKNMIQFSNFKQIMEYF